MSFIFNEHSNFVDLWLLHIHVLLEIFRNEQYCMGLDIADTALKPKNRSIIHVALIHVMVVCLFRVLRPKRNFFSLL